MRTITLNGKEFKLAYNLRTACAYENMTGKNPFGQSEEEYKANELNTVVTIGYCMLLANNDPYDLPDMEEFMKNFDDVNKTLEFVNAVHAEINAYFRPTAPQKEQAKKAKKGKKADGEPKTHNRP